MKIAVKKKQNQKGQFPKKYIKGKVGLLSVFVITVGFLIYFVTLHLIPKDESTFLQSESESFAAGKDSTVANPTVIEAENMSYLASPDGIQTFEDSTASGNAGKFLSINTTIAASVNLEAPTRKIILTAKGNSCHGGPNAVVAIGGTTVMEKKISSKSWNDYTTNVTLYPGSYSLTITFNNDFSTSSGQECNRDLIIDKIVLQ